jgi:hypothetical protein
MASAAKETTHPASKIAGDSEPLDSKILDASRRPHSTE